MEQASYFVARAVCSLHFAVLVGCGDPGGEADVQASTTTGIATLPAPVDPGDASTAAGVATDTGATGAGDAAGASAESSTGEAGSEATTDLAYPDLPTHTCESLQIEGGTVLRPVDIIFAIDTSGSMTQEAASVVANMNSFSQLIVDSGADAHVILIADPTMCIAAPLGSGQCAGGDDKPDDFVHLDVPVGSTDALVRILETAGQWTPYLRPNGAKHLVVVSDDDSSMKLVEFHTKFSSLGPGFADYTFHAIASPIDPDTNECGQDSECCQLTAEKGLVYLQLVAKTGGVFGNLCEQDFAPVFAALAEEIVEAAPIACVWPLPGAGLSPYDHSAAAVRYALDGADFSPMQQVPRADLCPQGSPAWHYDDEQTPTAIVACPWTCSYLASSSRARVDIELPCKPQPQG